MEIADGIDKLLMLRRVMLAQRGQRDDERSETRMALLLRRIWVNACSGGQDSSAGEGEEEMAATRNRRKRAHRRMMAVLLSQILQVRVRGRTAVIRTCTAWPSSETCGTAASGNGTAAPGIAVSRWSKATSVDFLVLIGTVGGRETSDNKPFLAIALLCVLTINRYIDIMY